MSVFGSKKDDQGNSGDGGGLNKMQNSGAKKKGLAMHSDRLG